jgi:hypothetical protein
MTSLNGIVEQIDLLTQIPAMAAQIMYDQGRGPGQFVVRDCRSHRQRSGHDG